MKMSLTSLKNRLSRSVRVSKCFKWDAFKTMFYMKNETVSELFNFYGTLHFILSN